METTIKKLRRYPGTRPFNEDESKLFFGREDDIRNLYDLVSVQNLIVLYGTSGLGKSSLLHAGLAPRFREDTDNDTLFIRFGTNFKENNLSPIGKLIKDIKQNTHATGNSFLSEKLSTESEAWGDNLWYLIKNKQIVDPGKHKLILVFDHFEEIFTYPEDEITAFKKQLSELIFVKIPREIRDTIKDKLQLNKELLTKDETTLLFTPLNIKVIFAVRSDKLSLLNNFTDCFPSILQTCYELRPLNSEQAKAAIISPAMLSGPEFVAPPFVYTNEVIEHIISSLRSEKKAGSYAGGRDEIEPFQLQMVCRFAEDLAIEKGDTDISVKDLGNIKDIFENSYRNIINKLPEKYRLPARQLIEEKLIIDGTRVCMPIAYVLRDTGVTKELLDELIESHIIRPEQNNAVEISHDTLIEPILKYYEERKKMEAIALEIKQKDEQINKIKEEQALELKRLQKRQRFRMRVYLAVAIVLFVVLPLIYSTYQNKKILNTRTKAFSGYLRKARTIAKEDPTKALPFADSALQIIIHNDGTSYRSIKAADSEIMAKNYFYSEIIKTTPGSVICISDDAAQIITTGDPGQVKLWGINGKCIKTLSRDGVLCSAGFSKNGQDILLGYADGSLVRWNMVNGQTKEFANQGSAINTVIYAPGQKQILVCTNNNEIRVLDSAGSKLFQLPGKRFTCAIFSPDGSKILAGENNGIVTLWDINGKGSTSYTNWNVPIRSLAFSERGHRFICGTEIGFVNIWKVADNSHPLVTIGEGDYLSVGSVCIDSINLHAKFLRVCTADDEGNIELVDLNYITIPKNNTLKSSDSMESIYWYTPAYDLLGIKKKILCIKKVKRDTLISGSADGSVKLWYKISEKDIKAAISKYD